MLIAAAVALPLIPGVVRSLAAPEGLIRSESIGFLAGTGYGVALVGWFVWIARLESLPRRRGGRLVLTLGLVWLLLNVLWVGAYQVQLLDDPFTNH